MKRSFIFFLRTRKHNQHLYPTEQTYTSKPTSWLHKPLHMFGKYIFTLLHIQKIHRQFFIFVLQFSGCIWFPLSHFLKLHLRCVGLNLASPGAAAELWSVYENNESNINIWPWAIYLQAFKNAHWGRLSDDKQIILDILVYWVWEIKSGLPPLVLDTSCCNISLLFQSFFEHNDDLSLMTSSILWKYQTLNFKEIDYINIILK